MQEAHNLETIGRMAGAVTHDFNNLLTVIAGHGHLLLHAGGLEGLTHGFVQEIVKAGDRAALMTHQLEALTPRTVHQPTRVDLNALVGGLEKVLRRLVGDSIAVEIYPAAAPIYVAVDPRQVEQVLLNLAMNAHEAMAYGGAFILTVTANETQAQLTIRDTGCGIDTETRVQLFDPSFVPHGPGQGSVGLGFDLLRALVHQNGGAIEVQSELGLGTTFQITLPRATIERAAPDDQALARGHETILLVEDDAVVRTVMRRTLETAGYWVLEAADEADALDLGERHQGPIHLLLTDVVMPLMNGRELADRLLTLRPLMQVLFVSGHPEDAVGVYGVPVTSEGFLQKPFAPHRLAQRVRKVLQSP